MAKIHQPHDKMFKAGLSDPIVCKQFLQAHLPKHLLAKIDFDSIKVQQNTFINPRLKDCETDVLLQVMIQGKIGYIYILCEHQSSLDYTITLRLWGYVLEILKEHLKNYPDSCKDKTLPVVIPLVYYNGADPYVACVDFFDLFGEHAELAKQYLLAPFILVDLSNLSDESLLTFDRYMLMFLAMKYCRQGEVVLEKLWRVKEIISKIEQDHGDTYLCQVLEYIIATGNLQNVEKFCDFVSEVVSKPLGERIMTLADVLEQRGIQQGVQQSQYAIAAKMVREGTDVGFIVRMTGLTPDEVVGLCEKELT